MPKSWKPKDNNYIDSSGIIQNDYGNHYTLKSLLEIQGRNTLARSKRIENTSFDSVYNYGSGIFSVEITSGSTPKGNDWYFIFQDVMWDTPGWAIQVASRMTNNDSNYLYIRKKVNGVWGTWRTI